MGLYSTNRVAAVNEFDESINDIIESTDWTPDFSIGSVMEAVIQIHENDAKMFDSIIECDFISAQNSMILTEADAAQANDAADKQKKIKIGEKIKNIIDSVINFIKKVASNVIAKIVDLTKSDAKLVATYKNVLTVENLKDFKGIPEIMVPGGEINKDIIDRIGKTIDVFCTDAKTAKARVRIDNLYDEFKRDINNFINEVDANAVWGLEKKTNWKFESDSQIKDAIMTVQGGSIQIKKIKENAAKIIAQLKKLKSSMNSIVNSKAETTEDEVYIANKAYSAASESVKALSKAFSVYNKYITKQLSSWRKAVILCGRAAAKAVKGEKATDNVEESMVMYALGEASDQYVIESLEY